MARATWQLILGRGPVPAMGLALAMLASSAAAADQLAAYIDVRRGDLPIILTVPHGGTLRPDAVRTRTFGRLSQDSNTAEIAEMVSQELQRRTQAAPHVVYCRLHRTKIDCNRDLAEAAQGDAVAIAAWKRFHEATKSMSRELTQKHGAGLLLDIHGHRHEDPRVELGYLVTGAQLGLSDAALNADAEITESASIRELVTRSARPLATLLRGPQSLGAILEERGFPSIPSPSKPAPGEAPYYSGVYTITAHGSRNSGTVSAIQVECPWKGVRDTPANQRRFAQALAEAVESYFKVHFQMELRSAVTSRTAAPPSNGSQ